jgi:5-hydroxyisourate hydrolase
VKSISTHVLDVARGKPAAGLTVTLDMREASRGGIAAWHEIGRGATDADGRCRGLLPEGTLAAGIYRITFDTGGYFRVHNTVGFFPEASIVFEVHDPDQHYHVPLLLSPYGYSTYRGS